ncbi:MAG: hypothetical protein IJF49_08480 [Clostridia bacterium]|nr:hypothetical protein [Clostridia bacterium]
MRVVLRNLDRLSRSRIEARIGAFIARLAEVGEQEARMRFAAAAYDGTNDVKVHAEPTADGYRVVAEGQAVAFIEFGSGILQPPYPADAAVSHPRGVYGQGKGSNLNGWVYVGEQGSSGVQMYDRHGSPKEGVYRTKGNPPAAAMYHAVRAMRDAAPEIAREVFGK